ncbi:MAG: CooT family nickel-binding protein [Methanosarcinaceae archaeon]|nr:CooT family nickel-binding protein [Methanosarcinaceae archaeon]MDD4331705.1 CooT family nickel-binding protein [Methanosarcinaceae archaeon]MDD4749305.1 CooT family nickel-binding protein [Methanosarcinaceae archaeon]
MCELNVVLQCGEERKLIMESVAKLVVEGDFIELTGILGDRKTVSGSIKEINFSKGEALLLGL